MIFEPDIIEHEDCVGCRPSFGKGWYWQIQRRGFMPGHEELYNASTTRQVINRQTWMEFSWHRRPVTVLGVSLDGRTLQSFVEHLTGDELEVRAVHSQSAMLLVRQGAGMGVIFEVTFSEHEVPDRYLVKHDDESRLDYTFYKESIATATNRTDFAQWVHACAHGPEKVAHRLDFERAEKINAFNPTFGAPVPTLWFDEKGRGPDIVEVLIEGHDVLRKDGSRDISGRVGISMVDTALKGGGSFNIKSLTDLIANLTTAREWLLARQVVEGCDCGICGKHTPMDGMCDAARDAQAGRNFDALRNHIFGLPDLAPTPIWEACDRYPCAVATRIAEHVAEFGDQPDVLAQCIGEELG